MAEDCKGFDALFARNVPHILDKIFLALDYDSFKRCQEVNNTWKQSLTSETIKTKAKTVFHKEISKELLNACECHDSNHYDEGGKCKGDNTDEVKRLLSTGMVDVNCVISDESEYEVEETPLGVAVTMGHKNVVRALLDAGADPNRADNIGSTPLHDAIEHGRQDRIGVVNMLLDWGADINKKGGHWDKTPLHIAAGMYHGDPEMVELLINRGAEVNVASGFHGWTPYDSADERDDRHWGERGHRHSETLSLLRKHGGLSRYDWPGSPYYRPLSE